MVNWLNSSTRPPWKYAIYSQFSIHGCKAGILTAISSSTSNPPGLLQLNFFLAFIAYPPYFLDQPAARPGTWICLSLSPVPRPTWNVLCSVQRQTYALYLACDTHGLMTCQYAMQLNNKELIYKDVGLFLFISIQNFPTHQVVLECKHTSQINQLSLPF